MASEVGTANRSRGSLMRDVRETLTNARAFYAVVAVTVAVFVAQRLSGMSDDGVDGVRRVLGFDRGLVLEGEVWRIFTPNLIHTVLPLFGVPALGHLLMNLGLLLAFGPTVERLWGPARFVPLYVLAGSFAFGWLVLLNPPAFFAGGASGAIYGTLGALLIVAFASRQRSQLPRWFKVVLVLPLLLVLPGVVERISWQIHLGGLLFGAALGFAWLSSIRPGATNSSP